MTSSEEVPLVSTRDREILRAVIQAYTASGEPVSSRAVAKRHGLSSASIRNTMADLEELGYLAQPHSSAGRVPTGAGYHFYIESLMEERGLSAREKRYVTESLKGAPSDAEGLVSLTGHLLSELSDQAGIVLAPAVGDTVLRTVDFIPMSDRRVLCVVVSASGFVDSKVIETEGPLPREELVRISNFLTDNYAGQTLRQIRDALLRLMAEERAQVDRLLSLAVALASQGLAPDLAPSVVVDGAATLLAKPEFSDIDRVRRLLDTFADRARLVQLLNRCMRGRGVRVFIGADDDLTSDLDFSLVATTYGRGDRTLGSLGIFGPSRMEYPRMIPLVHFLGEALTQALQSGDQS